MINIPHVTLTTHCLCELLQIEGRSVLKRASDPKRPKRRQSVGVCSLINLLKKACNGKKEYQLSACLYIFRCTSGTSPAPPALDFMCGRCCSHHFDSTYFPGEKRSALLIRLLLEVKLRPRKNHEQFPLFGKIASIERTASIGHRAIAKVEPYTFMFA